MPPPPVECRISAICGVPALQPGTANYALFLHEVSHTLPAKQHSELFDGGQETTSHGGIAGCDGELSAHVNFTLDTHLTIVSFFANAETQLLWKD